MRRCVDAWGTMLDAATTGGDSSTARESTAVNVRLATKPKVHVLLVQRLHLVRFTPSTDGGPSKDWEIRFQPPPNILPGEVMYFAESGSPEATGKWRRGMPPRFQRVTHTAQWSGFEELNPSLLDDYFSHHRLDEMECKAFLDAKRAKLKKKSKTEMKVYAWKFTDIQKLDQPLLAPIHD